MGKNWKSDKAKIGYFQILKDKRKIDVLQGEQEALLADIECSAMRNHTNAAVAIQQRIAEKFIGVTRKISTNNVVGKDQAEKAVLERPRTPEDKIRTAPLKYKPSISSIDTQNFSQELEDLKFLNFFQDNVNKEKKEEVQDNVNKKKGKISDESRMEIENAYMKMKKDAMWKLSSGKFVEEELYNLGKKLEFEHSVHSFIIDTEDEIIKQHFREYELEEIDNEHVPKAPDLSQDVIDYLNKFINVTSANEVRSIIGEQDDRLNANYDSSKHHDLDYIRFVLYTMTREIENGGLKQPNLESWYNCHVWSAIVDHGFGDIKGLSVVRGESACVATATRKNSKRITTQRRQMGRRGDWILRMSGNGDHDEYGMGEVGKKWEDEFGTKFLREKSLKQPKALKDMLVKLIRKVNWDKELRSLI
ncbi:17093_t:CDS:10, partial [Cetraspora pellucida]